MIDLAVVCACGRRTVHEVGAVLLDDDAREGADDAAAWTRAVYVLVSLTCPGCGAIDEHSVEPASARALVVDDEVVHAGRAALSDGTVITSPSAGIAHLRRLADAAPEEATRWRALGNFAMRSDRSAEALEAWRRGAAIEKELECALAVAVDAVARFEPSAPRLVGRAAERLVFAEPQRRPLQSAQVAELFRKLAESLTLELDGERIQTATIRDWSRFGERLASADSIRSRID